MWQVRRIELILFLIVFACFIPQVGMAQNQTLRINIELPAGVGLNSGSSSKLDSERSVNNEVGPDLYGKTVKNFALIADDGSFVKLTWIKMQTFENSQFLLDFKNQNETGKPIPFFFLNDNTNNLESARSLIEFPALLNFNQNGLLIRSFVPRRITLSAWLGFYRDNQPMTLVLEYF
ncbi:MAG: hypothetical protein P8O16_09335 [Algoriphagus sp.]|uniref:hypothetical protein n=1 Tax=Algoriphagus sp. TaxID=1872435 RepID=UPI0026108D66|nr:hypothetical protein [Algoriphagus sp.]MDG1277471.1 hypothetical protein [Algoriphagus sp.]